MSNEDAGQLAPGDFVAYRDETLQNRCVTKVEKLRDGTVIVYMTGDIPSAEAKDVT